MQCLRWWGYRSEEEMILTHAGHKSRRGDRQGNSQLQYRDWCYEREAEALNPHFLKFYPPFAAISNATHAIKPSLIPQPEVLVPFSVP